LLLIEFCIKKFAVESFGFKTLGCIDSVPAGAAPCDIFSDQLLWLFLAGTVPLLLIEFCIKNSRSSLLGSRTLGWSLPVVT
jgi:hypothetical protein